LVAQYLPLQKAWQDLASRWANLYEYLTEDVKAIKAARKELRKKDKMVQRAKKKGASAVTERRHFVDAQALVEYLVGLWHSKPVEPWKKSKNKITTSKRAEAPQTNLRVTCLFV